jgi:nitroreductase
MSEEVAGKAGSDGDFIIHPLLSQRRSPRAFSSKMIEPKTLGRLLEAARWAPSSSNEQPWSFIVASKEKPEEFARMLGCLVEFNQSWAKEAPVLLLSVARLNSASSGKPNRHALHDVGQAIASLTVQAMAEGLFVHQMAGFDAEKARREFAIPEGYEPVAVAAIGYLGDANSLPEKLRERELAPRQRKPLKEFVYEGIWGQSASLVGTK